MNPAYESKTQVFLEVKNVHKERALKSPGFFHLVTKILGCIYILNYDSLSCNNTIKTITICFLFISLHNNP